MLSVEQIQAFLTSNGTCPPCLVDSLYQQSILSLLIQLHQAIEGIVITGGGAAEPVEAIWLPTATIVATAITATHAIVLTDLHAKKYINVVNRTNEMIFVSFDNSIDHDEVGPNGGSATYPLAAGGVKHSSNVSVRHDGVNIPTDGTVYISAYY